MVPEVIVGRIAAHHAVRIAAATPRARPSDGVGLRRLRRRGPLLQVLPDLQGVHEKHRRQIYLRPRAAAASSPCAPTAPSTPRRAQAQEDYYECLHHKKEFTRRNEVEAHRAAAGKGGAPG